MDCAGTEPDKISGLLNEPVKWNVVLVQIVNVRPPRTFQVVYTIPDHMHTQIYSSSSLPASRSRSMSHNSNHFKISIVKKAQLNQVVIGYN